MQTCPLCGSWLNHRFDFSVASLGGQQAPDFPFSEAVREMPSRAPTVQGDVAVPLCQAGITGLVVGLPVGVAAVALGSPLWVGACAFSSVTGIAWLLLLSDHRRLLRSIETVIGRDLDGDNRVGQVEKPPTVRVEVEKKKDTGRSDWLLFDLSGSPSALQSLASGVLSGLSLSESEWSGSGRPFSRSDFRALRSQLIERGLACWRNPGAPAQGVELTAVGRAVFRRLTTLPADE